MSGIAGSSGRGVRVPGISLRGGTPARAEEEHAAPAGQDQSEDEAHERTKPRPRDRLAQSDAQRVVQLLQARDLGSQGRRRVHATAASGDAAQARETTRLRQLQGRPDTLAKQILRDRRAVHPGHGLAASETAPMIRKPSTGEPYAGKPPVRFGGRGGQKPSLPLSRFRCRPPADWATPRLSPWRVLEAPGFGNSSAGNLVRDVCLGALAMTASARVTGTLGARRPHQLASLISGRRLRPRSARLVRGADR
jgi:hypothetical protein